MALSVLIPSSSVLCLLHLYRHCHWCPDHWQQQLHGRDSDAFSHCRKDIVPWGLPQMPCTFLC
jgi:hypothetical protein